MTANGCDKIRCQPLHDVDASTVVIVPRGLKVLAKIIRASEISRCETRCSSSRSVQERDERVAVFQRLLLVVRIGLLQARIRFAQGLYVSAIGACSRLTTPANGTWTRHHLPSAHSHNPTGSFSSFSMFGLGVTVLEVAATDVLVAFGAPAMVAISTALTPSLAIDADGRSVPNIRARTE